MKALSKVKQENILAFDIETAPLVKELEIDSPLFDSWSYKVNKDNSLTDEEVVSKYNSEAGLFPEFAKVVSIVVGKIVKGKIYLITIDNDSEADLLEEFNKVLSRNTKCRLMGFVNISFDSPFVYKRMVINGIEPEGVLDTSDEKPWTIEDIDLALLWKGNSFSRASLINVATVFGLPSPKSDISGADVGRVYWNEGKKGLERISEYCRKDVVTTINIMRKMLLQEPLEEATFTPKVEAPTPLIQKLFDGGKYGTAEKKELAAFLAGLTDVEREKVFALLDATTSTARGKKTKLTKTHVKALKAIKYE